MKTLKNQQGMSFFSAMGIVFMVGFFIVIAAKLVPIYMEDMRLIKSLETMHLRGENDSKEEFLAQVQRRLKVEFGDYVPVDPTKHMKVELKNGESYLITNYEVREHIFYNVDAVVSFSHTQKIN
ncbi:conserved hypothetical protein [Gammaproteobacteria bacterium]